MKTVVWIICFLCLLQISPAKLTSWQFDGSVFTRSNELMQILGDNEVVDSHSADLDGDGSNECITLIQGKALITNCSSVTLWQSPDSWQVSQAFMSDLNRDGIPEMTLLVWRPFTPWPIDSFLPSGGRINDFHDNHGKSCHLILIGWKRDGYNELWAGSALVRPVEQIKAVDLDGDGWQELIALESEYDAVRSGGTLTAWRWRGFGFVLLDEIKKHFTTIKVVHDSTSVLVLTQ
jgi:hypothetical protein